MAHEVVRISYQITKVDWTVLYGPRRENYNKGNHGYAPKHRIRFAVHLSVTRWPLHWYNIQKTICVPDSEDSHCRSRCSVTCCQDSCLLLFARSRRFTHMYKPSNSAICTCDMVIADPIYIWKVQAMQDRLLTNCTCQIHSNFAVSGTIRNCNMYI